MFRLSVREKGRTVLPVGLQQACGFAPGAELMARPIGRGQFVVESSDVILERIWSRWPPEDDGGDPVDALQEWRESTDKARLERLTHPEPPSDDDVDQRGAAILAALGL